MAIQEGFQAVVGLHHKEAQKNNSTPFRLLGVYVQWEEGAGCP